MIHVSNRDVNRINIHYAIQALAAGCGGIFLLVYFLKSGLSVTEALLALAAIIVGRFVFRPLVLVVARAWGLRTALIVGTVMLAIQFPLSATVDGLGLMLALRCIVSAIGDAFYWTSYHAYFSALGDSDERGHQIGTREIFVALIGIFAPILGTWTIVSFGPLAMFALAGLIQLVAILPLLFTPEIKIAPHVEGAFHAAMPGALTFVAHGAMTGAFILTWQIALFVTLGESLSSFGGAATLAAVVGAAGGLALGRGIDQGHGQRATALVTLSLAAAALFRAFSLDTPELAVAANAVGALVMCFYVPTLMTSIYNLSHAAQCPLRFQMATESGWDVGCIMTTLLAAACAAWGLPLSYAIVLALPPIAGLYWQLSSHYAPPR